jgi:hypothetical protein
MRSVIGQAGVVGMVAPVHQITITAKSPYHVTISAKSVLGLSEYV